MERDTKGESRVLPHGLSLQDRQKLAISGVSDVVNFDENQVIITTGLGTLTIRAGEQILAEVPLVAAEDVARRGWGQVFTQLLRMAVVAA